MLYPDFNSIKYNAFSGGILNEVLMEKWSESNKAMDVNETDMFNGGTMPVNEDAKGEMLKQALAELDDFDIYEAISAVFPDTEIQKCVTHQIHNSTRLFRTRS